jgi:hypothetical protein
MELLFFLNEYSILSIIYLIDITCSKKILYLFSFTKFSSLKKQIPKISNFPKKI